jgi:basic amino acid/polyamine antiporter, APA family
LGIALILYVLLSLVVTGIVPYAELNTPSPVTDAFSVVGLPLIATIIAIGAVASILSVLFAFMLSTSRIWFALSRDGLLPRWFARSHRWFARSHPRFRTPYRPTIIVGVLTAVVAGLFNIESVAELVNIGGLSSFIVVCAAVWILRWRSPELERGFRTPLVPLVPIIGIVVSLILIASLPSVTWVRFAIWIAIGVVIYFAYSRRHSRLATERDTGL